MNYHTFIATTGDGLTRATRAPGGDWAVTDLLPGEDVRCLAADPLNAGVVYAGLAAGGVLRSDDHGATWAPTGTVPDPVRALAVSPHESGTLYAGTKPPALYVSQDGGKSWEERPALRAKRRWWWFSPAEKPMLPYVQGLALSPTDPDVIMVGIELGAVMRSDDGGATWSNHRKGAVRDCHSLTFHATNGAWVYEGGGGNAAYSRDAGRTWTQPQRMGWRDYLRLMTGGQPPEVAQSAAGLDRFYGWAVAADPAQPDIWYFAVAPGPAQAHGSDGHAKAYIFRHTDGVWQRLSGGLPQPLDYMPYALITDTDAPGHVYAGLHNGDIWFSSDHGDSWQQLPVNVKRIERVLIALK